MRYLAHSVSQQIQQNLSLRAAILRTLPSWELRTIDNLQGALPSSLESAIGLLPYIGGVVAISVISLAVYIFIRKEMALHILMLAILISALGIILQWSFKLSPPPAAAYSPGTALYSFPDIPTARITGVSIFICFFSKRKWVGYVSIAVVALVSLSRLHGEAVYVRDIVGGVLLGISCVWILSRAIRFFRPVAPEITPSAFAAFLIASIVSCFGLFKIFMPSGNGGADFLGLPGGLLLGHYISAAIYTPGEAEPKEEKKITGYHAVIAIAVLGLSLYIIYHFIDPMEGMKRHIVLLILSFAAGALCMIILNRNTGKNLNGEMLEAHP